MNKKTGLIILLLLLPLILLATKSHAQETLLKRISKPYFWSQYTFEAPADIEDSAYSTPGENPTATLQQLQTGFVFPIYMGKTFRVLSGANVNWHYFDFSGVELDNINTFDLSIPINCMIPINEQWMIMALIAPGIHSDLKRVDYKDFKSAFLLLANYTYSEHLQISMGVAYSRIFGKDTFFPAAGLTWMPDDAWTIRLMFPKPGITYSLNERLRFSLGIEPAGGEWNIRDPRTINNNGEEYTFEFKGWRMGGGAEYDITRNVSAFLDAGFTINRKYIIENDDETVLNSDVNDTPGFRLGVQLHR
jgi:hypothetical protein